MTEPSLLSSTSTGTGRTGPDRPRAFPSGLAVALYAGIPLVTVTAAAAGGGLSAVGVAGYLPRASTDLLYSFLRMLAAYALSLGFSLAYGYYAATHRGGERVMIPVLDILQSVPILGFFPIVIVVFVNLTGPGSFLGPNLASVFLIFTSMAWNMVFGVYESVRSIPNDLREAAETFRSRGWLRFRRVLFPATVNRLVYNSVLSWTGGWFFLVEAEIFTTNSSSHTALPGIGSLLSFSAANGNGSEFVAGVLLLVAVIVLLDFGVWRPLGRWADRFRYDQSPSGEGEVVGVRNASGRLRRAASYVTRGVRTGVTRISTPFVQLATIRLRPARRPGQERGVVLYYVSLGAILVLSWLILIALVVAAYQVLSGPISGEVRAQMLQVPLALGASIGRVAAAYAICLAIALPLAILLARRARLARLGLPVIEVVASFPATALFPLIVFGLVRYLSEQGVALLLLLTGMIWYLFFNLLAGVRSLAPDLEEAARSYGVRGRGFLRRVLLPSLFPALVTGSITAFGGGWNTLIVAEYLNVNSSHSLSVLGIGQMIDLGYTEPNGLPLMVTALLTLVAGVIAINELLWKPLYRRAVERYRYD
ncbi:MAG TPA: ABC transporter permease subunit [Thermoplasmata archaeon]|nr:ABC transporter permease subunit [Thermoplasmata archaeon]